MIQDIYREANNKGWQLIDAAKLTQDQTYEVDVVIVGTGAGGGVTAELMAKAGFKVLMIEEGPLMSSADFDMRESTAYPNLYQEQASRSTKDQAIKILQGRAVGGSTTVNWTSSFRTPDATLKHWEAQHNVEGCAPEQLAPWFEKMEARLNISNWPVAPNANNAVLVTAAKKLQLSYGHMKRNVKDCWNLGYCGTGCPINAKLSMLVTSIPEALSNNAGLIYRLRAERFVYRANKVAHLEARAMHADGVKLSNTKVTIRANHFVLASGSIGSPAILLRSKTPDPHDLIGKRTFLHPVVISSALFKKQIAPYYGAPQSVYSDHFLWSKGVTGPLGYKIEVPPLHPLLVATVFPYHGKKHRKIMRQLPNFHALIALGRDGFHPESQGGHVNLHKDGYPQLSYPISEYLWRGFREAYLSMAEMQFAAGAAAVMPVHLDARPIRSWPKAKAFIEALPMQALRAIVASAHVMGGCSMGRSESQSVVNSYGRHHQIANLSIHDGSIFPTSLGVNPQLSIYGIIARNTDRLIKSLREA